MKAVEFHNVWKKFKRGEKFNSLRDAVPNFAKRMIGRKEPIDLAASEFWAVQNVSFEVNSGEVVGIIGPNGAGKSTILKLLSRIMTPTRGEMKIHGRLSALIEVTAGFHPDLTGRENVYLNGTILGMNKKEIDSKFDEIVEFSGLAPFIDTPVKRYSSGMYSRLGFSVAAHVEPDVLIVDEVLSVGDIAFQSKCAQKMREMLASGTTILLVSHNLQLVQNLCSRVIVLDHGAVQKEGAPHEVIPIFENLMFHRTEEELRRKVEKGDDKVRLQTEEAVELSRVVIHDGSGNKKENFRVGNKLAITVEYRSKDVIDSPVFSVEVIRADGVIVCASNTKDDHFLLGDISGASTISLGFDALNLAPGIYLTRISVWDKDLIHPYTIRKKDLFVVEATDQEKNYGGVFYPKVHWSR